MIERGNQIPACSNPCMFDTVDVVNVSKLIQVNKGQGDGDTKWKGCPWKALRCNIDIFNLFLFT